MRSCKLLGMALVLTCVVLLSPSRAAQAGELSIGAVAAVTVAPYKSYDTLFLPLPFITYKSDRLYVKGTSAGVHLFKNEAHELSVGVSYLGLQFSPSKTDNHDLKQLDKRRSTMLADLSYSYITKIGLLRATVGQDVLGKSDGALGELSLHIPWIRDNFIIMPGIGVQYASAKHNDYYYGVSSREAARSGLWRYKPGDTFSPFATLEAKFNLTESWDIVAKGRLDYLSGKVKDSPMIGKSYAASIMAGVQYNF